MTSKGTPYGITISSRQATTTVDPQVLDDAIAANMAWIRFQVLWSNIELVQGVYDASAMAVIDDAVDQCQQRGLHMQFPLQSPPTWRLSPTACGTCPPSAVGSAQQCLNGKWHPHDPASTAAFADFLSKRYNGVSTANSLGKPLFIDAFEIGNEEMDNMFCYGQPITVAGQPCRGPALFIPVLQACAPKIRTNSPNALIGMGALWWEYSPHRTSFMQALYDNNCKTLFDYANFHFYSHTVDPTQDTDANRLSLSGQINEMWQVMNGAGDGAKQIWVTEIGWTTPAPTYDLTEAQRVTYLQEAFDICRLSGHVGVFNYFTMNYTDPTKNAGSQSFSLTRYPQNASSYTATYRAWQTYSTTYPDWGGVGGPPPGPTLITVAVDSFTNRTVGSGWGSASDGTSGAWVATTEPGGPTAPTLAVSPAGKGQFSGVTNCIACVLLGTQVLLDGDVLVRTKVTVTGDNTGPVLRSNAAGTIYYRCSLSGGILELTYLNNGVRTNLYQSATLSYSAGTSYWLRFRIIGTTLQGRYWANGTTEPADFTNAAYAFTVTDTRLASGQFGLRARTASNSSVITFDALTVSSIGAVPPPSGGALVGSFAALSGATINLTTQGGGIGGDWAHWGLLTGTTFDSRNTASTGQITDFSLLGNASAGRNAAALNSFTYTDGTPNAMATASPTGSITVPPTGGGGGGTPHIMLIALENEGYNAIVGSGLFPKINALLNTYSTCTQAYAINHPSLPNYLAVGCGSDHNITIDLYDPAASPLPGKTLVDQLAGVGIGWKHYAENLPSTGYIGPNSGSYVQHHNPWVYFTTVRTSSAQQQRIVNYNQLAGDLTAGTVPPFVFIQPNDTHNGHNSGTETACDDFTSALVTQVQASSWYAAGGVIVLWWDEAAKQDLSGIGDGPGGGRIASCFISSTSHSVSPFTGAFNHYGLLGAIEKQYGVSLLLNAAHVSGGAPLNGDPSPLLKAVAASVTTSNLGNGFALTAPADANSRTLKLYVDAKQGAGSLAASLSDGSAPDYYDSSLVNLTTAVAGVYTLTYNAGSSGNTLSLLYTLQSGVTAGSTNASDTLVRANTSTGLGTSSDGETYTLVTESGVPAWKISSNTAQMTGGTGDIGVALLGTHTLVDSEQVLTCTLSNLSDSAGLVARANTAGTSYLAALVQGGSIQLISVVAGVVTVLNSQTLTLTRAATYKLRLRCVKTMLYARCWLASSVEPTAWSIVDSDTTFANAGRFGMRGGVAQTGDSVSFGGTYTVLDLSATGDPSAVSLYAASLLAPSAPPPTGLLAGSISTPSGTINLTVLGVTDWAHWGLSTPTTFDHKASGGTQITTFTPLGG